MLLDAKLKSRFMSKIEDTGHCWLWTSALTTRGYGFFWVGGKKRSEYAHRVSYRIFNGEIPDGHEIMHSCDNPKCVNPSHLLTGTGKDNQQDALRKGRKAIGERNKGGCNKLTALAIARIKICYGALSYKNMAEIYKVHPSTIKAICLGRSWKSVSSGQKQALA